MNFHESLGCRDSACPSRNECRRFTRSEKLSVLTWGRLKGEAQCVGFIPLFEKKTQKKLDSKENNDIMP